jgi:hypothetical protein
MRKYLFAFVLSALVLTACRAESNIIIDIAEDGSATVSAEIGFDDEMLDLLSQTGGDPEDLIAEDLAPEGAGFEQYSRVEGDMTFYGFSSSVDDISENAFLELGQDFAADFATFSYESDGGQATLTASIASADIGGGLGDLPIDPTDITGDIFSANLIISMPGTVIEHNADEVRSDGSLVWDIPLTGTVDVIAVSDVGSGSSSWILWLLLSVLAIGIIAGIAAVIVSRKDSKKAVDQAAADHAAAASNTPPPPAPATPALSPSDDAATPALDASDDAARPALDTSDDADKPALDASDDADKPALDAADEAPALGSGDATDSDDAQDDKS